MNSAKIFYYEVIRKPVQPAQDVILQQIRETSQRLESAYSRFENECNEDLLDSIIYEIKSLKALYRYLLKLAKEKGVYFLCEASVGGGIPIICSLIDSIKSNTVTKIYGIINGTTNFILTKMDKEGVSLDEALSEAKRLGFAEFDATADLEAGNGNPLDGRKIKGTIHWLSAKYAEDATLMIYDKLFTKENMNEVPSAEYADYLNPESLVVLDNAMIEPCLKDAKPGEKFQFVRTGYFTKDSKFENSFNRIVGLKDSAPKK